MLEMNGRRNTRDETSRWRGRSAGVRESNWAVRSAPGKHDFSALFGGADGVAVLPFTFEDLE